MHMMQVTLDKIELLYGCEVGDIFIEKISKVSEV